MILLDAMMQLYRANYSLSDLVTKNGRKTGMEYGFLKSLEALRRYFKDEIVVCWEGKRDKIFRYGIDPEYKANRREKRQKDAHKFLTKDRIDEFKSLLSMVAENAVDDELEADDVIASLAERYCKTEKVVIYSSDKDLHQLIRRKPFPVIQVRDFQWRAKPWTVSRVEEKYHGLKPKQLATYFAFIGDAIDNIKGVNRVRGSLIASAMRLGYTPNVIHNYELFSLREANELEEFYESGQFHKNLKLVTLKIKDDIVVKKREWDATKIKSWLEMMEFRTLKLCEQCKIKPIIMEGEEF